MNLIGEANGTHNDDHDQNKTPAPKAEGLKQGAGQKNASGEKIKRVNELIGKKETGEADLPAGDGGAFPKDDGPEDESSPGSDAMKN